jgi:hypothetical protein
MNRRADDSTMWRAMLSTEITIADWLEVIRAEDYEVRHLYPFARQIVEQGRSTLLTVEELVMLVEIECLKRARRRTYLQAS